MLPPKNNNKTNYKQILQDMNLHSIKQVDDNLIQSQIKHYQNHHEYAMQQPSINSNSSHKRISNNNGNRTPVVKIHAINLQYKNRDKNKLNHNYSTSMLCQNKVNRRINSRQTQSKKGRLKTLEDRQNVFQPLVMAHNHHQITPKSQHTLSKTTRVHSTSKLLCEIFNNHQENQPKYNSIKHLKSIQKLNSTQELTQTRTQHFQKSLSKLQNCNKMSPVDFLYSLSKDSTISCKKKDKLNIRQQIEQINNKQQLLLNQKLLLQQNISKLRSSIEQQKQKLQQLQTFNQKITNNINLKKPAFKQSKKQDVQLIKKIEIMFNEVKMLRNQTLQFENESRGIIGKIQEENQLISNYQFVINEMKKQFKMESKEKAQLQKLLSVLKKHEKVMNCKKMQQEIQNYYIFGKVYDSLGRWK